MAAMIPLNVLEGAAKYALAYPLAIGGFLWLMWYGTAAFARVYRRSAVKSIAWLTVLAVPYMIGLVVTVMLISRSALR